MGKVVNIEEKQDNAQELAQKLQQIRNEKVQDFLKDYEQLTQRHNLVLVPEPFTQINSNDGNLQIGARFNIADRPQEQKQ